MENLLICEKCGNTHTYEQAKRETEKHYNRFGEYMGEETYLTCYSCGGVLVEAKSCPGCERVYITEDEDICQDCYEEAKNFDTCFEIGEENYLSADIKLNGFLAMVYSDEEIEKCLIKDFQSLPRGIQEKYFEKYLDEDLMYLANWIKEKRIEAENEARNSNRK